MNNVFPAPFAKLFQFELALDFFDVFVRPIIVTLTCGALKSYEVWLWHDISAA